MVHQIPGETPLVQVGEIFSKLECANPCGSIKDRIAHYIITESEKRGCLKPGMQIVEATSGNTGISLSYYARQKKYPVTIVMPKNMTEERKAIIQKLGAKLILCDAGDFAQAAQIRDEMAKDEEFFNTDQFSNPLNVECHYRKTGQEILSQMESLSNSIDAFVAGVGTGGTLIGVAKALREAFPNVHIAAVEPSESPVMSGGEPGCHSIYGIGDGFIPAIAQGNRNGLHELIDEVICIDSQKAIDSAQRLREQHGFCIGISSGANYEAALKLRKRFKTVVTVFADGYAKYQSEGLQHCGEGRCRFESCKVYETL